MASVIVFDCQKAIPNSMIPKTSANEREKTIAVSTAVAPSSHPRVVLLRPIAISDHCMRVLVSAFNDFADVYVPYETTGLML
jgi:hypothetical protein